MSTMQHCEPAILSAKMSRTLAAALAFAAVVAGCSKSDEASKAAPADAPSAIPTIAITGTPHAMAPAAAPSPDASPLGAKIEGKNFVITTEAGACVAGQECKLVLRLAAGGGYHVNKEYPYKFVATEAAGVTFLGKDQPTAFSRQTGDFVEEGEKAATLSVRFRPAAKGNVQIAGTFKMSVCSEENCQVEQTPIAVTVPVS